MIKIIKYKGKIYKRVDGEVMLSYKGFFGSHKEVLKRAIEALKLLFNNGFTIVKNKK